MWPVDEPEPEQSNKSIQSSPDLSSKWGQVAIGLFFSPWLKWNPLNSLACMDQKAMYNEVQRLQQVCGERPLYTCFYLRNETGNQNRRKKSRGLSTRPASCRRAGSSTRRAARKCYPGNKSCQKREPNPYDQNSKPTSWD